MWYCVITMLLLQVRQTYVTDISGNRVPVGDSVQQQKAQDGSSSKVETIRDMNGRQVPLDRTVEKVVQDDGRARIIERTTQRYDPNGIPGALERVRVEERKNADGTVNVDKAVYRSDLNGSLALAERSVSESAKSGDTVTTNTTVTRQSIDGAMRVAERSVGSIAKTGEGATSEDVVVYRPNDNGQFTQAARTVTERREKKTETIEDSVRYQAGEGGKLEVIGRNVSRKEQRPDGSEVKEVTVYGTAAPSRYATGKPEIREQQLIEKRQTADGAVEVFSVRRPELDNQQLGAYHKVSEQVCSGSCQN